MRSLEKLGGERRGQAGGLDEGSRSASEWAVCYKFVRHGFPPPWFGSRFYSTQGKTTVF